MEPATTKRPRPRRRSRSRRSAPPSRRSSARSTASRSPTSTAAPAPSGCWPRSRRSTATSARHHSNVHRGSHTLSAEATAAYEGARATVADHIGAADRREVIFVRNATEAINLVARAWGDANVGAGDRIVLTEMEHHSNIVPWQQLAERVGAEIDWVPVDRRRACSTWTRSRRCSSAGRSWSRSPTSPTCSAPRTRSPRSPASPTRPARWCSPTAPRRRRSCRSTSPSSASTSTRSPATSSTRRPGSARSGRGSTCCARCRPSSAAAR